jgi:hypothetical protein
MTTRSERLNRLVVRDPCATSWDAMDGEGARRFCSECGRHVVDFAQLDPAAIHAHLEASRGRLCARLTRRAGQLVVAPPAPRIEPERPIERRRAPALAATLVSAWLVAGARGEAAEARPAEAAARGDGSESGEREPSRREAAAPAAGAGLRGRVVVAGADPLPGSTVIARAELDGREHVTTAHQDGSFAFAGLPPGLYEIEGEVEGYDVEPRGGIKLVYSEQIEVEVEAVAPESQTVTSGVTVAVAQPMRQVFADSELVAVAVAGASRIVELDGGVARVITELRPETIVKGAPSERRIGFLHFAYVDEGADPSAALAELAPGTRVLAFLEPASDGNVAGSARRVYQAVDHASIKRLGEPDLTAYVRRLEALRRLERRAARLGERDPAAIVDWLVETAEDPLTRGEALDELSPILDALAEQAESSSTSVEGMAEALVDVLRRFRDEGGRLSAEPPLPLLGAFVDDGHRRRLTSALESTRGLMASDRDLFGLVFRWDAAAALDWLAARLPGELPDAEEEDVFWWLWGLAEELGYPALATAFEEAYGREEEVAGLSPDDDSEETDRLRQQKLAGMRRELRQRFAEALATR